MSVHRPLLFCLGFLLPGLLASADAAPPKLKPSHANVSYSKHDKCLSGHGIHHPVFGVKMKEKADAAGVECHLLIPGISERHEYGGAEDFLIDKLLAP